MNARTLKECLAGRIIPSLVSMTSIGLVIAGMAIPPPGVIDPSVLTATGILLAFKALDMLPQLIRRNGSASISVGQTTLSVSGSAVDEEDEDPC